jgi:hypothetical protein
MNFSNSPKDLRRLKVADKSKVLSVRLSLDALQSCFDFCEALDCKASGASSALSRFIETITKDYRLKGILPTYSDSELELLLKEFVGKKNPVSMASLEKLNQSGEDFNPLRARPTILEEIEVIEAQIDEQISPDEEYNDLIEEQIRERMKEDEDTLLAKIMLPT